MFSRVGSSRNNVDLKMGPHTYVGLIFLLFKGKKNGSHEDTKRYH